MGVIEWATRPISAQEARWRTGRAFRGGILGLWAGIIGCAGGMAHRWVARDYDGFVLCWFGIFLVGTTIFLVSLGALQALGRGQRLFFGISALVSAALLTATTTATFSVPHGVAEQFEGVLIKTRRVPVAADGR